MSDESRIPSALGRYTVLRLLGSGAMGSVYLAEDPRLKRKVAIKVIKPDAAPTPADRQEILARFEREAEVSSLLNDPGVVTIYDLGDAEAGPFLAMEYVEGQSLEGLIRSGASVSLPVDRKLALLETVALALDHAHRLGVVHRDVKPANIMVTLEGRAKLMDFGIAHRQDAHLTRTGTFLGTPTYASPEQIREATVDGRSDLFSLGVVAFELLSGQVPFPGTSLNTILFRIVHEPPVEVPPVPGILQEAWNRVFQKVLAKDPSQRHGSCMAFVEDLHAAAQGEPLEELGAVTVRSGTLPSAAPPVAVRHARARWPWVTAGVLVLAAGSLPFFLGGRARTLTVRSQPEGAEVRAGVELLGRTPLEVRLPQGRELDLSRPGFQPVRVKVPGSGALPEVHLVARVSQERLVTDPPGASVLLDGTPQPGVTPLEVRWSQDRPHEVRFTFPGGGQLSQAFAPGEVPGSRVFRAGAGAVVAKPEVGGEGRLSVTGTFPVRLKVDGRDRGEQQPPFTVSLPAGDHVLEWSAPGVFFRRTDRITLRPGQATSVALPPVYQVVVSTFPTDGPILVDGQPTGINSDEAQIPIPVAAGTHVFSIQGRTRRVTVEVQGDLTGARRVYFPY